MSDAAGAPWLDRPFGAVGRAAFMLFAYLGGLAGLLVGGARVVLQPIRGEAVPTARDEAAWMLMAGMPLTALVHVGMGSFLSMQAYFGGTFVDGTGAVVGVGLIRNLAPLLVGFVLSGLFGCRLAYRFAELGRPSARPAGPSDQSGPVSFEAHAGPILLAAVVAGPALAVWASLIGTLVGWQVSGTLLGVSTDSFFMMFLDMIWTRDVVGLVAKGAVYSLTAALFAVHEGALASERPEAAARLEVAALRATCFSAAVILFINSAWFILIYHAGAPFGPTLMSPPTA